jgi:hypothetical protein
VERSVKQWDSVKKGGFLIGREFFVNPHENVLGTLPTHTLNGKSCGNM